MPNNSTDTFSHTSSDKPSTRAPDAAKSDSSSKADSAYKTDSSYKTESSYKADGAKLVERAEHTAEHATSVAAEKARQVRDEVSAKASGLQQNAKAAIEKVTGERVEDVARSVVTSAKEALTQAKDQGSAIVHDVTDAALDTYNSARDYATHAAHDASELAQRAGAQTASYVRKASTATGRFVSVHALPLTLVGASLGWLAWSIRQDARRSVSLQRPPTQTRLQTTIESRRYPALSPDQARVPLSGATPSGAKLMGVRVRDVGYEE